MGESSFWPWLSEECLSAEGADPRWCGLCGARESLVVHQEHGGQEEPLPVFVVLCEPCAARVIDAHPRLYTRLDQFAPAPGAMPLCIKCGHRAGTICTHPSSRYRGGPGVALAFPEPMGGFWDGAGKGGRRAGGQFIIYQGPVRSCAGRTA